MCYLALVVPLPAAEGNEGLNDTALPSFASYANSSAAIIRHGNLSCPVISGQHTAGRNVRLSLDPSYLNYSHCVCAEGMEVGKREGLRYLVWCQVGRGEAFLPLLSAQRMRQNATHSLRAKPEQPNENTPLLCQNPLFLVRFISACMALRATFGILHRPMMDSLVHRDFCVPLPEKLSRWVPGLSRGDLQGGCRAVYHTFLPGVSH